MLRYYHIEEFGARPDGRTLNTAAIQRAIDMCHSAGGGRVVCGPGTYLTGTLDLKSHVELHLERGCQLLGSPSLSDYQPFAAEDFVPQSAPEGCTESLIRAVDAEDIAITGPGAINGNGLAFYDIGNTSGRFFRKPGRPRPRLVMFYRCRDVRIEASTFVDSPCWTMWLMKCERVSIRGVRIHGDQRMINNDGIDLDACRDVTVSDCIIKTGDDCIVLRALGYVHATPGVCENVTITNCVLDSWCQGVRVGCPGDHVVRNCVLSNLVITSTGNGIVFDNPKRYLREGAPGTAEVYGISFSHVTIRCENAPIKIYVEEGIELPRLGDLSFSHLRIQSGGPCRIEGNPRSVIRNVTFDDVEMVASGDQAVLVRHAEGIRFSNVRITHLRE